MKEIKESQQASQGINIGNSANQGGAILRVKKGHITNKTLKTKDTFLTRRDHQQKAGSTKTNNQLWISLKFFVLSVLFS